ncbi:hypothetical protein ANN_07796 [Periplaneta americana]|uniref:Uncharacterized protein n=1 Tax=Periplaneta americana TaxID=6978 RepID=A0ABQ8T102_PERAM|nr:hypothetical protein ANN_07796 [Periplaneta americana]
MRNVQNIQRGTSSEIRKLNTNEASLRLLNSMLNLRNNINTIHSRTYLLYDLRQFFEEVSGIVPNSHETHSRNNQYRKDTALQLKRQYGITFDVTVVQHLIGNGINYNTVRLYREMVGLPGSFICDIRYNDKSVYEKKVLIFICFEVTVHYKRFLHILHQKFVSVVTEGSLILGERPFHVTCKEETILRDMLLELNDSCEQYGMKINGNKTKTMVIGRNLKKQQELLQLRQADKQTHRKSNQKAVKETWRTHIVDEDPAVIRSAVISEQIDSQCRHVTSVSIRHATCGSEVASLDGA